MQKFWMFIKHQILYTYTFSSTPVEALLSPHIFSFYCVGKRERKKEMIVIMEMRLVITFDDEKFQSTLRGTQNVPKLKM